MAKFVKVATFMFNPVLLKDKPQDMDVVDYEIAWIEENINKVLIDKPDLIVLPEVCDRPGDIKAEDTTAYYAYRGEKVVNRMQQIAKQNNCYIALGAVRTADDGFNRNSLTMIDRQGNVMGHYDKNHLVLPSENVKSNCICGREGTIFECDFGRVGAVICFDLNFEEIRAKYKKLKPDLMLFSSNFGGGLMKNFFAFETRSYFVSACGYECPAEIINPLGETLKKTANHYNYLVEKLNLDFAVVHLDNHRAKMRRAKEKYGELLKIDDIGFIGVSLLTYFGTDTTAKDILKEFDIIDVDEYLDLNRRLREDYISKD